MANSKGVSGFDASATTGGSNYRCARGGCDSVIGHPANQDQHNQDAHQNTTGGGTDYRSSDNGERVSSIFSGEAAMRGDSGNEGWPSRANTPGDEISTEELG